MKYAVANIYYDGQRYVAKLSYTEVRPIFNQATVEHTKHTQGAVVKYDPQDQFCHIVPIEEIEEVMNEHYES